MYFSFDKDVALRFVIIPKLKMLAASAAGSVAVG
jgi:hypothetical protein